MTKGIASLLLQTIELRSGSVITEREILALKRRWRPISRSKNRPSIWEEYQKVHEHLPMRISSEQASKGRAWLSAQLLKKDGTLRGNKLVCENSLSDGHARIVNSLDHFDLVAFDFEDNGYGLEWPYPIYRAVSTSGEFFEYVGKPWKAGPTRIGSVYEELAQC